MALLVKQFNKKENKQQLHESDDDSRQMDKNVKTTR